jgi:hypothetical protein
MCPHSIPPTIAFDVSLILLGFAISIDQCQALRMDSPSLLTILLIIILHCIEFILEKYRFSAIKHHRGGNKTFFIIQRHK